MGGRFASGVRGWERVLRWAVGEDVDGVPGCCWWRVGRAGGGIRTDVSSSSVMMVSFQSAPCLGCAFSSSDMLSD